MALHIIAKFYWEFLHPLNVVSIDMRAAFDSVNWTSLWKMLRGNGVPLSLFNLIQNYHEDITACIRVDTNFPSLFTISSGVHQGCILAPSLFCCTLDWIISRCAAQLGIDAGSEVITNLLYVDNADLFVRPSPLAGRVHSL